MTLAGQLQRAGYRTAACASIPFQTPAAGIARGFEDVDETAFREHDPERELTGAAITACARRFLDQSAGRPLLLWVHYIDVHAPYDKQGGQASDAGSGAPARTRYRQAIAHVDRELGSLQEAARAHYGPESILTVLTADHGEEFQEHGGQFHARTLYEEVLRVPLFIAAPKATPHAVRTDVSLIDVAPTVLELCGAPRADGADGRSLVPAVFGESLEAIPIFAELALTGHQARAVIRSPHKLIVRAKARTYELYDLDADPAEQHILTKERPDLATTLAPLVGASF